MSLESPNPSAPPPLPPVVPGQPVGTPVDPTPEAAKLTASPPGVGAPVAPPPANPPLSGIAPFPGAPGAKKTPEELARLALVPVVENVGARCPRCGVRLLTDSSSTCPRCKVDPRSAEAGSRLVAPGVWWMELLRGASYVPRGAFKILVTPRLWAVSALPLLLNISIFVVLNFFVLGVLTSWLEVHASPKALENWDGFWWGVAAWIVWGMGTLAGILKFVVVPLLLAWLMGAFPFSVLLRAVFTPLASMVAERTEQLELKLPEAYEPFNFGKLQSVMVISIVDTLLLALLQGCLYVLLLPINIVPALGTFVWMIVPPAIFASMDHSDPNLCRKNYYTREKVALWRLRMWRFLGFGFAFFFLLGVPFVNAVIFPTVAAGGALLYLELDRK